MYTHAYNFVEKIITSLRGVGGDVSIQVNKNITIYFFKIIYTAKVNTKYRETRGIS